MPCARDILLTSLTRLQRIPNSTIAATKTSTMAAQGLPRRLSKEEVVDALFQKKLALDKEVEDFRRVKDEEFRRFEQELKSQAEHEDERNNAEVENWEEGNSRDLVGAVSNSATRLEACEANEQDSLEVNDQKKVETAGAEEKKNISRDENAEQVASFRVKGKEDAQSNEPHYESRSEANGSQQGSTTSREKAKSNDGVTQNHHSLMRVNDDEHPISKEDRELELRAFFTPSFLPLLEDSSHRRYLRERSIQSESTSPETYHHSTGDARRSETSQLSSSLTTLPSLSNNRIGPGSNATDQPRLGLGERRCSSSPTGTGRTLRSSLRSPDHVPRERKHVLFSIDDKVISPSTSPAAIRSTGKKVKSSQRTPPIPFSGLKDFPFPGMKASGTTESAAKPGPISIAGANHVMLPPRTSPTHVSKSYKDLVEPTIITPPDEVDKGDLKIEASDPMFDLDDPERGTSDTVADEDEDWAAGGRASARAEEEEEDKYAADIAVSPHAGSVPIEIKWPGRRG